MLVLISLAAMGCALIAQYFVLVKTRASLARYESSLIPTSLGPNEFRVIANKVLQTDNAIVIEYRIESSDDHFAKIESDGDSNGGRAAKDSQTNLFVSEAVLFIDYIETQKVMKVMPKVSGAQGYSVLSVEDDFSFADAISVHELESVYSREKSVPLVEIEGRTYSLKLEP